MKFPKEVCLDNCNVTIVDSLYRRDQETDGTLEDEITKANAILLVYDVTRPDTIDRLGSFWMGFVSSHSNAPVILVGNKADLKQDIGQGEQFEDIMRPLARDYKQCEIILECSAKTFVNLTELYMCSQRVVLYPTSPLYDSNTRQLTPEFERALYLIFRRCDKDQDFILNDSELADMHADVFQNQLGSVDMDRIKEVVSEQCEDGVTETGMNIHGFLQLQRMMIQRLKINVCWNLLRHFGFNEKLQLEINHEVTKTDKQSVELSRNSIHFLITIFRQYSRNAGSLTDEDIREIFSTTNNPPWAPNRNDDQAWLNIDKYVQVTPDSCLTLQSWLALWHMLTLLDHKNALYYLVHIGFAYNPSDAFVVTKEREIMGYSYRKVFCGFVLGITGTGKTSLINAFLDKEFNADQTPSTSSRAVCKVIEDVPDPWECKYLVLIEYPTVAIDEMNRSIDLCDVAIFLNDGRQDSEEFIKTGLRLSRYLPKISVRTKSDEPNYRFINVSAEKPVELFREILEIARHPIDGVEESTRKELKQQRNDKRMLNLRKIMIAAGALALGIILLKKFLPK